MKGKAFRQHLWVQRSWYILKEKNVISYQNDVLQNYVFRSLIKPKLSSKMIPLFKYGNSTDELTYKGYVANWPLHVTSLPLLWFISPDTRAFAITATDDKSPRLKLGVDIVFVIVLFQLTPPWWGTTTSFEQLVWRKLSFIRELLYQRLRLWEHHHWVQQDIRAFNSSKWWPPYPPRRESVFNSYHFLWMKQGSVVPRLQSQIWSHQ